MYNWPRRSSVNRPRAREYVQLDFFVAVIFGDFMTLGMALSVTFFGNFKTFYMCTLDLS